MALTGISIASPDSVWMVRSKRPVPSPQRRSFLSPRLSCVRARALRATPSTVMLRPGAAFARADAGYGRCGYPGLLTAVLRTSPGLSISLGSGRARTQAVRCDSLVNPCALAVTKDTAYRHVLRPTAILWNGGLHTTDTPALTVGRTGGTAGEDHRETVAMATGTIASRTRCLKYIPNLSN